MKFKIGFEEIKLLTGTPEAVTMLRNRVFVPEELLQDVYDWLDINAHDLWYNSECYFYFLDGMDHGNVHSFVIDYKKNQTKNS